MTRNGRPDSPCAEPLFAVAMLRIALELKKEPTQDLEALVAQTALRMRLDAEAFRRHLQANLGLLRTTAKRAFAAEVSPRPVRAPARSRRTQRG